MAMKNLKYVDINTLYKWAEFEVSPLITFPCKNNWKTNIEYIEGSSDFSGWPVPSLPLIDVRVSSWNHEASIGAHLQPLLKNYQIRKF